VFGLYYLIRCLFPPADIRQLPFLFLLFFLSLDDRFGALPVWLNNLPIRIFVRYMGARMSEKTPGYDIRVDVAAFIGQHGAGR
jgi:hypothetical protein